jgi:uncharacterized membrane protein
MGMSIRKLVETVWVAEAMLIGLALFFALVGGALTKSTPFLLATLGAVLLLALHQFNRHRVRNELELSPEYRRLRERRGF